MADRYLVDTGVLARWYIEQIGFEHALEVQQAMLAGELVLETVDCVRFELAHVLRTKAFVPGLLSRADYLSAVRMIDDVGLTIHRADVETVERAAGYAADWNLRFFDALLVDAAAQSSLTLLTTDRKLCNAVGNRLSTELLRGIA